MKTVSRIVLWIFLVVYLALILSSILTLFWPVVADFLKEYSNTIIIGVFSAVGISLVWDILQYGDKNIEAHQKLQQTQDSHLENLNRVLTELNGVKERQYKSLPIIENLASSHSSFVILDNSSTHYQYFNNAMSSLKKGQSVLVTAFEKYNYKNYDSGSSEEEQKFMDNWLDKIEKDHLVVKHLIHVSDMHDYVQLINRIENIKKSKVDYSINVICGLPLVPYMDFAIIGDSNLIISFADGSKLFDNAFALGITDKDVVAKFRSYFNIYFDGEFSKNVYSRNDSEYYEEVLKTLEEALPSEYPKKGIWEKNHYLVESIKHQEAYVTFSKLVHAFKDDLSGNFLKKLLEEANKISNQNIVINQEDAWELLTEIVKKGSIIKAVSNEIEDEDGQKFWNSPTGKRFLQANIEVITKKKGSVHRIFITNTDELEIIRRQKEHGITVKVVQPCSLKSDEFEDFILIDSGFLLKLEKDKAILSINHKDISKYNQRFNKIFNN